MCGKFLHNAIAHVRKVQPNKRFWFQIYGQTSGNKFGKSSKIAQQIPEIFGIFWYNFGSRNARNSIKGSKDSYYNLESNKTLRHKISTFVRLPGDDDVIVNQTKTWHPKLKQFSYCKLQHFPIFRGFEYLSSSTCCRVVAGQSLAWEGQSYFFLFLSKIGFLSHNFGSNYARKPIKVLQTRILA